jgi:hypothetical protein
MTTMEARLREAYGNYNRNDLGALTEWFALDADYYLVNTDRIVSGRRDIQEALTSQFKPFTGAQIHDLKIKTVRAARTSRDDAVACFEVSFIRTGRYALGTPRPGPKVRVPFTNIVSVNELGLIVYIHEEYDSEALRQGEE